MINLDMEGEDMLGGDPIYEICYGMHYIGHWLY